MIVFFKNNNEWIFPHNSIIIKENPYYHNVNIKKGFHTLFTEINTNVEPIYYRIHNYVFYKNMIYDAVSHKILGLVLIKKKVYEHVLLTNKNVIHCDEIKVIIEEEMDFNLSFILNISKNYLNVTLEKVSMNLINDYVDKLSEKIYSVESKVKTELLNILSNELVYEQAHMIF